MRSWLYQSQTLFEPIRAQSMEFALRDLLAQFRICLAEMVLVGDLHIAAVVI
jgi:hypothetical protein